MQLFGAVATPSAGGEGLPYSEPAAKSPGKNRAGMWPGQRLLAPGPLPATPMEHPQHMGPQGPPLS